jgi:hypothetical protein
VRNRPARRDASTVSLRGSPDGRTTAHRLWQGDCRGTANLLDNVPADRPARVLAAGETDGQHPLQLVHAAIPTHPAHTTD